MKNASTTLLMAALVMTSFGFCGGSIAQERYTISVDGSEVLDSRTGLTWKRCAEGAKWTVRGCAGEVAFYTQPEAAAYVVAAGGEWRFPTLRELSSIAAPSEAQDGKAALNPKIFPSTPVARFWTSSSAGPGYFAVVVFSDGSAGESVRTSPGALRLIKTKQ